MRRLGGLGAVILVAALPACGDTFACESDAQCEMGGQPGVCQPATGFCSFPASDCDSGQRYGDLAPSGLAGTCVPVGDDGTGSSGPTSGGATSADPSATSGISTSADSTTGPVDPTVTSTTTDADSTDGDPTTGGESCCDATCPGACAAADQCPPMLVGSSPPQASEAIGVATVGELVVWSTGFGRSLMLVDPAMGVDTELAFVSDNSFVTRIAADDTHVYFLDHGAGHVRRASVPGGLVDLVTDVPGGEAGFGGIAVDDTHVYFAMRTSGGIYRSEKDSSSRDVPQLVAPVANPFGVALDASYLFFIDTETAQVRRIALDEIGVDDQGTVVVDGADLSAIAVDDDALYYGDGGTLRRADKLGSNQGVQTLGSGLGNIWNIAVDDTHVYLTSSTGNAVHRGAKNGLSPLEDLANTSDPWGLALTCDAVYWAENGTQTLQRRPK